MKIIVLNENYVDKQNLISEHGLSILVLHDNHKIMFDTGQNLSIITNYDYLANGINKLDFIILSHGHYDHTGGIAKNPHFFKKLTDNVVASKYVFDKHLRKNNEESYEDIGLSKNISKQFKFQYVYDKLKISDNLYIISNIKRYEPFNADVRLFCEIDKKLVKDPFRDELYVLIKSKGKHILITGCSHSGIINIVKDCQSKMNIKDFDYIIGGMHLYRSDVKTINRVLEFFNDEVIVKNIVTGHCTGVDAFSILKSNLKTNLIYMKTGTVIDL